MTRPLALLLSALIAGCLSLGGQRRPCPEGTLATHCKTAMVDNCNVVLPIVNTFLCVPFMGQASAEKLLNSENLAARANCIKEIHTVCEPLPGADNTLPPLDMTIAAELRPQAWGDPPCADCVTASCPDARAKCTADATCSCLDACQATGTPADECACPGPLDTYNAFQVCAADHCTEACSASGEACTCP